MDTMIFKGSSGLNNKVDPERLPFDRRTGLVDVPACFNVVVDRTGRVSRVTGYSQTQITESSHSLFPVRNEYCLYVSGTSLKKLSPDLTTVTTLTTVSDLPMSYCLVDDDVFYLNGIDKGIVRNGASIPWVPSEYIGPTTHKKLYGPPNGWLLEAFNGRMYIVDGKIVWFSEPFSYSHFRLSSGYLPFDSPVSFISSVRDGLVISDSNSTYTLVGSTPQDFRISKVADYPAIANSTQRVSSIPAIQVQQNSIIFATTKGFCAVTSDCQFINLTEQRLWYPEISQGCSVIIDDNFYFLGE